NILWDLGGPGGFGRVKPWIRQHGSERFTFSGDMSYAAMASSRTPRLLESILESSLPDEDKANILGRNVRRLFGLPSGG
ncbi:MAG: hypothetical protein IIC82_03655, partial [Chloroflexi bacterium]|nr:hypothetical protein [Chloroflexota bacterium]